MSYLWSFHSFSASAFERIFGGSDAATAQQLLDLVNSDISGLDDKPAASAVARLLLSSGFSYEGFDARAARLADDIVKVVFSPEGFEDSLEVEHLSPDGVHPSVINELIGRTTAAVLPVLLTGRRCGEEVPAPCEYCILDPGEIRTALTEIRAAMSAPGPWSQDWVPDLVRECLIDPLEAALVGERWLYCDLG